MTFTGAMQNKKYYNREIKEKNFSNHIFDHLMYNKFGKCHN